MGGSPTVTRRDILWVAGAAVLGSTIETTAQVGSLEAQVPLVVDSSVSCKKAATNLRELGVKVVIRYYAREKQEDFPTKILTRDEADALFDNGLGVALSYQHNNGVITSFDQKAARDAATYCLNRDARGGKDPRNEGLIKHPDGTLVYFGIDNNFPPQTKLKNGDISHNDDIILAYFKTIGDMFKKTPFRVGVYGSGRFCRMLAKENLASHFWLPGSTAWSETPEFYNGRNNVPPWNMYQKAVEVPLAGIRVDTNILNPKSAGIIGAFGRDRLIDPLNNGALLAKERFLTRRETFLDSPDGQPIVRNVEVERTVGGRKVREIVQVDYIERRKMVTLVETASNQRWARIEGVFTEKDDLRESEKGVVRHGYVRRETLAQIDQMPE
jgi:hypothetical protein